MFAEVFATTYIFATNEYVVHVSAFYVGLHGS